MKRIFEETPSLGIFHRWIVTDETVTHQVVNSETTAEFEKRVGMNVSPKVLDECNGEIYGKIVREYPAETFENMGWRSAGEFIRERMHTKRISEVAE